MTWLQGILQEHPEIAFFLVLGLGYLFGKVSFGSFKLGAVTGTLLAGVLVGQLGVSLPNEVKQCFFLLFLFSIGFRTGPQFFRGLKSDGLAHAALAAIVATTGLVVAFIVAKAFGYDAGTAAGLVAGALTELGDHWNRNGRDCAPRPVHGRKGCAGKQHSRRVRGHVSGRGDRRSLGAVATCAAAPARGPGRRVSQARGRDERRRIRQHSARREFEFRAYAVDPGSCLVGRSLADLEALAPRIFVEQVRRRGDIVASRDVPVLREGDVVAVAGRRTTLVEVLEAPGSGLREVDDRELLEVQSDVVDVVVTNKAIEGRTLADLALDEASRGVFLRTITRAGTDLGKLADTIVHRGDVLTLVGSAASTTRAIEAIGVADRVDPDVTDMMVVATGIVAGALIGLPRSTSVVWRSD